MKRRSRSTKPPADELGKTRLLEIRGGPTLIDKLVAKYRELMPKHDETLRKAVNRTSEDDSIKAKKDPLNELKTAFDTRDVVRALAVEKALARATGKAVITIPLELIDIIVAKLVGHDLVRREQVWARQEAAKQW